MPSVIDSDSDAALEIGNESDEEVSLADVHNADAVDPGENSNANSDTEINGGESADWDQNAGEDHCDDRLDTDENTEAAQTPCNQKAEKDASDESYVDEGPEDEAEASLKQGSNDANSKDHDHNADDIESEDESEEAISDDDATYEKGDDRKSTNVEDESSTKSEEDGVEELEEAEQPALQEKKVKVQIYKNDRYKVKAKTSDKISISGLLPEDAVIKAFPVNVGVDGQTVLAAYDITIWSRDEVFQPVDNNVEVKISLADIVDGQALNVYHIEENGDQTLVAEATADAGSVSFDASHFSIYVITDPEVSFTHTYRFFDRYGNLVDTQIISDNEYLYEPKTSVTANEHERFVGWFFDDDTKVQGFGSAFTEKAMNGELTENLTSDLHEVFEDVWYVTYMSLKGDDGTRRIADRQTYTIGDKLSTVGVNFQDLVYEGGTDSDEPVGYAHIGWSTTEPDNDFHNTVPSEYPSKSATEHVVDGDIVLYPILRSAHWINFETNSVYSIVDAEYIMYNEVTREPSPAPVKTGYIFDGWYIDEDLTQEFEFGHALSEDITLYAKWRPGKTEYTIIYWAENVTKGTYTFVNSRTIGDVDTDTVVSGSSYSNWGDGFENAEYYVFDKADQNVTVKGDGTTVVNVYYKRKEYTFVFDLADTNGTYHNNTMTIGGRTYTGSRNAEKYTITVTLGQDISALWPTASNVGSYQTGTFFKRTYTFRGWQPTSGSTTYVTKRTTVTVDLLPTSGTTTTFRASYENTTSTQTINYWFENIEDSNYTKSNEYSQTVSGTGSNWSAKDIDGFVYNSSRSNTSGNPVNFYYDRIRYKLTFMYLPSIVETEIEQIKYASPLNAYDHVPVKGSDIPVYYEFCGWYTTPECLDSSRFDCSTGLMPDSDLVLYAKWSPMEVDVTFNLVFDLGDGSGSTVQARILAGTPAREVLPSGWEKPSRDNYTFLGWVDEQNELFNLDTPITGDVHLTALWSNNQAYHLYYDANSGSGTVPVDQNKYAPGSYATVQYPSEITPPQSNDEVYAFQCWNTRQDGFGTNYYPGSKVLMPMQDMTLYAKWSVIRKAEFTYNYNYPVGVSGQPADVTIRFPDDTGTLPNTPYILALDNPKLRGYIFKGWTIGQNDSAPYLMKGDEIRVDTLEGNSTLYAQWEVNENPVSIVLLNEVSGALADRSKYFAYNITWKSSSTGQTIKQQNVSLKANQQFVIGAQAGQTVVVTQTDYSEDGYYTFNTLNENDLSELLTRTILVDVDTESELSLTYVNSKDSIAPTEARLRPDNHFGKLMLLLVAVFIISIFTKGKKSYEENL